MTRTLAQSSVRVLLGIALMASPLIASRLPVPLFPIAMGVVLAYDGVVPGTAWRCLILLIITELIWGIDLGVLSLAYLMAALVMRVAGGFVSVTPLARERGWYVPALLKTVLVGWVLALVMTFFSVLIQSIIYQRGGIAVLTASLGIPSVRVFVVMATGTALGVLVLHRIDAPFRRPIRFGT